MCVNLLLVDGYAFTVIYIKTKRFQEGAGFKTLGITLSLDTVLKEVIVLLYL